MKLHFAMASPFARKVRMAASELGLDDDIELVPVVVAPGKSNPEYADRYNPLRKIPSLTLDDGTTLFDSAVICEYLDSVEGHARLYPRSGPRRWQVLTAHALANGMTDLAVLLRYEHALRPPSARWEAWVADHWEKIDNGLAWFEKHTEDHPGERIDIAEIALACLLGYLDFRFDEHDWRKRCPRLAHWHEPVSQRPSYRNTAPR